MNYPRKCVFHLTKNYAQATRLQMKHPLKESTKPVLQLVKRARETVAVLAGRNLVIQVATGVEAQLQKQAGQ